MSIREAHINIWLLPAFFGSRHFLDLGLYVKNGLPGQAVDHIRVIVPFEHPETTCLVSHMEDRSERSWRVIFRDNAPPKQARMRSKIVKSDEGSPKNYSSWKILFDQPLEAGEEKYVRVRFASYDRPAYADYFGGFLGVGSRLRLDLRLFDYREHIDFLGEAESFETKAIPIYRSGVYLVAPQARRPEMFSPEFSYIRVLESALWMEYLQRKPTFLRPKARKMHIFAWKLGPEPDGQRIQTHRVFMTCFQQGLLSIGGRLVVLASWIILLLAGGLFIWNQLGSMWESGSTKDQGAPLWVTQAARLWPFAIAFSIPGFLRMIVEWTVWAKNLSRKLDLIAYGHDR